ncbi:hypothetical protein [Sciscionella marina]|uniref:hypothetical protein n=1 Tax=Sciscionella marina TaxID=508770 RepID=UPI000360A95E|nr:hypothetical protein [Sciscionella marina]
MSDKTDFYVGCGKDAEWLGSLQWNCNPRDLLVFPPGHCALTATDETTYRRAVTLLFAQWEIEQCGRAYPRGYGWP